MQQDDFLTLRLPRSVKERLEELSKTTGIPASAIARSCIASMVGQQNEASRTVTTMVRRVLRDGLPVYEYEARHE